MTEFLRGYLEAAIWSSTDDRGQFLDYLNFDADDFTAEALASMEADCADFLEANAQLLASVAAKLPPAYQGHDFWLTRNGHGAGFWDRGLGEAGEKLSEAAKVYGSCDIYVGDDGKLHDSRTN